MKKCAVVGIVLMIAYVLSYFVISRVSLAHNRQYGIICFFYAPACSPVAFAKSKSLQRLHEFGKIFFYPIWWLDYSLGGPEYVSAAPQIYEPTKTGESRK